MPSDYTVGTVNSTYWIGSTLFLWDKK